MIVPVLFYPCSACPTFKFGISLLWYFAVVPCPPIYTPKSALSEAPPSTNEALTRIGHLGEVRPLGQQRVSHRPVTVEACDVQRCHPHPASCKVWHTTGGGRPVAVTHIMVANRLCGLYAPMMCATATGLPLPDIAVCHTSYDAGWADTVVHRVCLWSPVCG